MNIKGLLSNPILPIEPKARVEGGLRTQTSTDRDADGRHQGQEKEQKHSLSQQEFDDCMVALEANAGLKSNGLVLKVERDEGVRVVLILDPQGGIVRRLSEAQLWTATRDKDRKTGKILDKAM